MTVLRCLRQLRQFTLLSSDEVVDEELEAVGYLSALSYLVLRGGALADAALAHLVALPSLVNPTMCDCPGIGEAGIAGLMQLTHHAIVDSCPGVSDAGLACLQQQNPHLMTVLHDVDQVDESEEELEDL